MRYDRAALVGCGGFGFWASLPPEHAGEDRSINAVHALLGRG